MNTLKLYSKVKYIAKHADAEGIFPKTLTIVKLGTRFAFCVEDAKQSNMDAGEWLPLERLKLA